MTLLHDLTKLTDSYTLHNITTVGVDKLIKLIACYAVGGANLTIHDMSERTTLGVSTVRKYVKEFPELLVPKRGTRRKLLFKQDDLDNLIRIKAMYLKGHAPETVAKVLNTKYVPRVCDTTRKSRNKKD